MPKVGESYVEIKLKTDKLEKELRDLRGKVDKSAISSSNKMKESFTTSFAKIGALVVGAIALFKAFGSTIDAVFTQRKAEAKVAQAIKTTGQAAGFSALEINKMATELQNLTGIGDEVSLNDVFAQLLTFTNITGDSFRRASVAAADLATVIGTDMRSQTIQLGKALEDPIAGVGALSRVGITFTDVQKDMIKGFMAQNDLASAQSIILDEIETKYGGQAKAAADAAGGTKQLSAAWGDFEEAIGEVFLPLLNTYVPKFTKAIQGWVLLVGGAKKAWKDFIKSGDSTFIEEFTKQSRWMSEEQRNALVESNKLQIEKNKLLWQELRWKSETTIFGKQDLYRQQKNISIHSRNLKLQNEALLKMKDVDPLIESANIKWTSQGKTLGEIGDRIKNLSDRMIDLVPNTPEFKSVSDEIKSLNDIIKPKEDKETKETTKTDATKKYYDDLKFQADGYLEYRKGLINQEADELQKAAGNEIDVAKWKNEQLLALEQERFDAKEGMFQKELDASMAFDEELMTQLEEKQDRESELKNEALEAEAERANQLTDISDAKAEAEKRAVAQTIESYAMSSNASKKNIGDYANAARQQIKAAGAKALADVLASVFSSVPFPFNLAAAPVAGLAASALFDSVVPKFAQGGDFVVPQGYAGDSFPMMVQSGERVQVTPANRTGNQDKLLSSIDRSLQILKMQNIDKSSGNVTVYNTVDENGLTTTVTKGQNRFTRTGLNTDEFSN